MSKLIMINPKLAYHHRLFLLEDLPKNSICAEIGVCHGTFSEKILEICNPNILHLIDPYLGDIFNHNKQYLE